MKGDPGLFGPGSMVWRIHREAAVLAGGQRALLMQVAHPSVAAAIAEHSEFPAGAWRRLARTLESALAIAFGTTVEAEAAIARVNEVHARVVGPGYRATDPTLLLWVHATLIDSAVETYRAFVGPLSSEECDRYHEETKRVARMLGATELPAGWTEFRSYLDEVLTGPDLAASNQGRALARSILRPPPRAVPGMAFWPATVITAGLLPERIRDAFGITFGRTRRAAFAAASRTSRSLVPRIPGAVRFVPRARAAARRAGVRRPG